MGKITEQDFSDLKMGVGILIDWLENGEADPDLIRYFGMLLLSLSEKLEE